MRYVVVLLIIVCSSLFSNAQVKPNQSWGWSNIFKGVGLKSAPRIAVDIHGNVYSLFEYYGTLHYGKDSLVSGSLDYNAAVIKHDRHGKLLFIKRMYCNQLTDRLMAPAIAVDADENVYIAGSFEQTLIIGSKVLFDQNNNKLEGFVAKLDKTGKEQWILQLGGDFETDRLLDVTIDNDQNIIASGFFYGQERTYGSIKVKAQDYDSHSTIFKINPSGGLIWVSCNKSGRVGYTNRVAVDAANNIYFVGSSQGQISYDGVTTHVQNINGVYVSKFSANGNHIWSREPKGNAQTSISSVAIDVNDSNHVFVAANEGYGAFVSKYDSAGNKQWFKDMGLSPRIGLTVDNNGSCYFSSDYLTFTGTMQQAVEVKWDGSLGKLWYTKLNSSTGDIACDISGNLYMAGTFADSVQLGDSTYYTNNPSYIPDVFITKLPAQQLVSLIDYDKQGYCAGSQATLYFNNADTVFTTGNTFVFELSDKNGSFKHPMSLGSHNTVSASDSFKFTVPATLTAGGNYRVRISSTHPVYYDITDSIFIVDNTPPQPVIVVSGNGLVTTPVSGTLQWYKDGQLIPGANGTSYTPTSKGNYTVQHTTSMGCSASSSEQFYVPVSVQELQAAGILVYPNPVIDNLFIEDITPGAGVKLLDVSGRVVYNSVAADASVSISTSRLTHGLYFLLIKLPDGSALKYKVVK